MSEYKGIKGLTIQEVASDPPAPLEGQVWYNTTTSVLKGYEWSRTKLITCFHNLPN